MFKAIVFLHILASMVWTGRHLILTLGFLPKVLGKKDFGIVSAFERQYEPIGMPALLVLVVTGVYMATYYATDFFQMDLEDHCTRYVTLKLMLPVITLALAIRARFFPIPKKRLKPLAFHIVLVTLTAISFVFVGFSVRSGGLL